MKNYAGLKNGKLTAISFKKKEGVRVYWLFLCDCGKTFSKRVDVVFSKQRPLTNCGCVKKIRTKPESDKKLLYREYIKSAKQRGFVFNLSYDFFKEIILKNCFYCGVEPLSLKFNQSKKLYFLRNVIDRVDNSIGYQTYNCVPCCDICNRAKRSLDYDVFMSWINRFKK
jgi:hypothetical protein